MATTTTPPTSAGSNPPGRKPDLVPIRPRRSSGPLIVRFYRSAVGKKWVMAVTGIILLGFILAHMIGNLKLYLSKDEINLYGEALRDMPGHLLPRTVLLWTIRVVLIFAFVFHIHSAIGLTRINRKARPRGRDTSRSVTTWPPTTPHARCAGPASSSPRSSSSISWISPGATPTRTSCAAIRTTT